MKGHETILELRRQNKKPSLVYLVDYPFSTEFNDVDVAPTVCIAGDRIKSLDLRFIFDLSIVAITSCEKRLQELKTRLPEAFPKDFVLYLLRTETDWAKKPRILINWNKNGFH